jgi:hypothetical protein
MAFYFAVRADRSDISMDRLITRYQVQTGGAFEVDYEVTGPSGKIILEGEKERQGDFVFTANEMGEYKFCFNNEMSTFAHSNKLVDFEIAVGRLWPRWLRAR